MVKDERLYAAVADYRPRTDRSPQYYFRTDKGPGRVRAFIESAWPWLRVYEVRELAGEIPEGAKERALEI
ncbi:MAG: hypothetical protein IKP10_05785 [Clostridia bacterium]|nr:hypothetical protein [Clostridia bacterium]